MKYAQKSTVEFRDPDGDELILKSEPTGSQYDERQGLLGSMRIPGNLIDQNTNMEELFAGGELIEINVDKKKLAEFQFRALFVGMTIGGRTIKNVSDAMNVYRTIDRASKDWIDEQVDSVWKKHEEDVADVVRVEGEFDGSVENSSRADLSVVDSQRNFPTQ